MTRGFVVSAALHLSFLLLFMLSPRPPAFDWDRADAIAVELVPLSAPAAEPPVEIPEVATVAPSEPEPAPVEAPPDPAPVQPKAKPKPFRIIRPVAPRREPEDAPSLMERIEERLAKTTTPAKPAEPAPEATAPASTSTASAEVHATDFPYLWYLSLVRTKITDVWDPPADRMVKGRTNRVLLRFVIHRDGRVTDVGVEGGSGTPGLDASAQRAVEQARPFPPLPDAYEGESLDVAVRFTVEGGA